LILRFYGAKPALFNKPWNLKDVEKLKKSAKGPTFGLTGAGGFWGPYLEEMVPLTCVCQKSLSTSWLLSTCSNWVPFTLDTTPLRARCRSSRLTATLGIMSFYQHY